jgi:hypothetical protein
MDLNKKIFKYCSYDVGELIISGQILKFSNPSAFNDPFDCDIELLEFNFDDCSQEIRDDMLKVKQKISETIGTDVSKVIDNIPKNELERIYRNSQIEKINKSSICCFSTIHNSATMWSHYSDKHMGLCLVFDPSTKEPFHGFGSEEFSEGTVNYDNYSTTNYLKSKKDGFKKLFLTKSKDWKYEHEYRYIIFENYGFFNFRKEFFKGVIFGVRVDENKIQRLVDICEKVGYKDLIFCRLKKNKLQLDLEIRERHET